MALLAIETATQHLGVAVIVEGRAVSSVEILAGYPHATELPGAVDRVLKTAKVALAALEAIIVDIGPGSFTGLRIGLAFAKALAFPLRKPLVGVASLDVLAAQAAFSPRTICPFLDAKRKNVYAARYRVDCGNPIRHSDYLLAPVDDVLQAINEPTVFLGDGCALYRDRILERCPEAQLAPPDLWLPRVATLGRLGWVKFSQGHRDDPAALTPMYLYAQTCQIHLSNRPPGAPRQPPHQLLHQPERPPGVG